MFEEGLRNGEDRVRALRHSSRRFLSVAGASLDGRVPAPAEVRPVEVRTRWPGDNSARGGTCAGVQVLLFSITRLIDARHTPVSIARLEKWTRSIELGGNPLRQIGFGSQVFVSPLPPRLPLSYTVGVAEVAEVHAIRAVRGGPDILPDADSAGPKELSSATSESEVHVEPRERPTSNRIPQRGSDSGNYWSKSWQEELGMSPERAPVTRAIHKQRWSLVIVPLSVWSTATWNRTNPVLERIMYASSSSCPWWYFRAGVWHPVVLQHKGGMLCRKAIVLGESHRKDLPLFLDREGPPRSSVGNHISARA